MLSDEGAAAQRRVLELELELAELRERVNFLEAGLETVPVGVVLADGKGRIFHGNSRVEELVRHPVILSESVAHYDEWISFHADGRQVRASEYPLSRVIADGEEHAEIDIHYQRGDGSGRGWLRIIGRPVRDRGGDRIGAAVAVIDIDGERAQMATQELLIGELNHRVKNAFSIGMAIVGQMLRRANVDAGLRRDIEQRLAAYSSAHSTLIGRAWDDASLADVADEIVRKVAPGRIRVSGDPVIVSTKQALAFSMAFYELATNALKHGSLSAPDGGVELSWRRSEGAIPELVVEWREHGGPLVVVPQAKGFGSFILDRAIALETRGKVDVDFASEGVSWRLTMPMAQN